MQLSGSDRKEILEAILDAYPNQGDLEMAIDFCLDENLLTIVNGNNYRQLIFNLIKWAESNNKLKDLIKGLCQENSGNEKLKSVQQRLFPSFQDFIPQSDSLEQNIIRHWNELYSILLAINNLELISQICRETLRSNQDDIEGNYPELNQRIDLSIIKEIFLFKYPKRKDNVPTIIEFSERLAKELEEPLRRQINTWISKTATEFNVSLPTYSAPNLTPELKSYLMITVFPRGSDRLYLQAELIPDLQSGIQPIPVSLNQESLEVESTLSDLSDKIYQFICVSKSNFLRGKAFTLTIEIFLPISYLGLPIDIKDIPIGFERQRPLGNEYRLVVRSLDRFNANYGEYYSRLVIRLNQMEEIIHNGCSQTDVNNNFEQIESLDACNWDEIATNLELKKQWGMKIICSLPENDLNTEEIFIAAIRGGIPLVLWTRKNPLPNTNFIDEFNNILDLEGVKDFEKIIESVWTKRIAAHAQQGQATNFLGYHLGFLYDIPTRLPASLKLETSALLETGQ